MQTQMTKLTIPAVLGAAFLATASLVAAPPAGSAAPAPAAIGSGAPAAAPAERVLLNVADDASITVNAEWGEIVSSVYKLHERNSVLADLSPAEASRTHPAAVLRGFLTHEPVAVGDTWPVDRRSLVAVLSQFHPSATTNLHHSTGKGGGYAVLRAIGKDYAEVMIRSHVDFKLADTADGITWLTPGQFEGRMLIDRRNGSVASLTFELPQSSPNFDTNAPFEHEGKMYNAADIGTIDRMWIGSGIGPVEDIGGGVPAAVPAGVPAGAPADGSARTVSAHPSGVAVMFDASIADAVARKTLAEKFYLCSTLDWVTPEEALQLARETGRPIHAVSLFGALEDESCCGSGKTLRKFSLENPEVVRILDEHFINVWLIGQDLPGLLEKADDPLLKQFYTVLKDNYTYPVDSVIVTPDAELVAAVSVKDVRPFGEVAYPAFLRDALDTVSGAE